MLWLFTFALHSNVNSLFEIVEHFDQPVSDHFPAVNLYTSTMMMREGREAPEGREDEELGLTDSERIDAENDLSRTNENAEINVRGGDEWKSQWMYFHWKCCQIFHQESLAADDDDDFVNPDLLLSKVPCD